ncbi:DNA primase [Fructilactobacillus vespulae]|uniref:DNA primase n=1 Tax=Fructilactobacillus vespulae TaxID=1249630 RepID=UPI0039B51CC0
MAKIPEEFVEKVRENTNITDIVGEYVQLKKAGKNLFGLCPFHEEKTPSFSVNEEKQIFHCFSCGRGGNVFTFLMDLKGLSFPEAIEQVADSDGISLPENSSWNQPSKQQQKQRPLIKINDDAANLYHHILVNTQLGEAALEYLHKRKISDEMIETFNLGFAPGEKVLTPFFNDKQVEYQTLRKTGLFTETNSGDLSDRFVNRIMFPIRNPSGNTVGFSGRLLNKDDSLPKYLNTPETELFNKRKIIYNIDLAKQMVRKEQRIILFEGFMDVISAYQSGVENGIASMGTSLTEEQIYDIKRITKQVDVCYDGDIPGQKAINRAVSLLQDAQGLNVGVIQMPNGVDPDEYRRSNGEESFRQVVKNGRESVIKFKIRYLKSQYNLNNEEQKLSYINKVVTLLAGVSNEVERDLYIDDFAKAVEISTDTLRAQIAKASKRSNYQNKAQHHQRSNNPDPVVFNQEKPKVSKIEAAERQLLYWMLQSENVWLKVTAKPNFSFVHDNYQQLYMFAIEFFRKRHEYNPAIFNDFVGEQRLQAILADLEMNEALNQYSDEALDDCVKIVMEDAPISEQIKSIKIKFNNAKQMGDEVVQLKLATKLIDLQKQLHAFKTDEQ